MSGPSYKNFDRSHYAWRADVDYRKHPEEYRIGKGEQGVLICEPYKSELVPHWRFKTPAIARESSDAIYQLFLNYVRTRDFIGADMARKFLQMGFTRARRYANYKGGRKYDDNEQLLERGTGDSQKAESADIFYRVWKMAEANSLYAAWKKDWKKTRG